MIKRVIAFIFGCLILLSCVGCGQEGDAPALSDAWVSPEPTATPEPTPTPTPTPKPTPTPEPYVSPIDFEALQAVNPDIYAWLKIEGTDIDYPVVQNASDGEYYLTHDSDGNQAMAGAIFSQSEYNNREFTDPVTILYGHNMASGAMFGTLRQRFSDQAFFDSHKNIDVYTPQAHLVFKVFAAVPYSDELIPYLYDFSDEYDYMDFFATVFETRDLMAKFDEANRPAAGDRVVILSTCITGTPRRFLVMATLESDLQDRSES